MEKFKNIAPTYLLRNIVNIKEIKDYLNNIRCENEEIKKWLNTVVKNYIIKIHPNIIPLSEEELRDVSFKNKEGLSRVILDKELTGKIEHIMGFLNEQPNRSWVNVPFEDMYRLANEYLAKKIKEEEIDLNYDNTKTIYESLNGYKWVEVLDEASLKREGKLMNHCVGFFVTESHLQQNNEVIYSLRDENNKPHLTMKYSPLLNSVIELKGNSNTYIDNNNFKYLKYLQDFLSNFLKPISFEDDILSESFVKDKEKEGDPHVGLYSFYKKNICILNKESLSKYIEEGFLDFEMLSNKKQYFIQDLVNDINKVKNNEVFIENLQIAKNFSSLEQEKLKHIKQNIYINELHTNSIDLLSQYKNIIINKILGTEILFNLLGSDIKSLDIKINNSFKNYKIENINHENLSINWSVISNSSFYIPFTNIKIKKSLVVNKDVQGSLGTSFEDCYINQLNLNNINRVRIKNSELQKIEIKSSKNIDNSEYIFENINTKELSIENFYEHQKRNIKIILKNCKIENLNIFNLKNVDLNIEGCEIQNYQMYSLKGVDYNIEDIIANNIIKSGAIKDVFLLNINNEKDWLETTAQNISILNNILSYSKKPNVKNIQFNKNVFEDEFSESVEEFLLDKEKYKEEKEEIKRINYNLKNNFEIIFSQTLDREKSDELYYVLPNIIVINQKKVKELYIKPKELHSLIMLDICKKKENNNFAMWSSVYPELLQEASSATLNYISNNWCQEKNIYVKKEDYQNLLDLNCFSNIKFFDKYINKKNDGVEFLYRSLIENNPQYTKKIQLDYESKNIDAENMTSLLDLVENNVGTFEQINKVLNYSDNENIDEKLKDDLKLSLEYNNPRYTIEIIKSYIKNIAHKNNKEEALFSILEKCLDYFNEDFDNYTKLRNRILNSNKEVSIFLYDQISPRLKM